MRIRTSATMAGARAEQVDVGFGEAITPEPIEIQYRALLDAPSPRLRAYPLETVVAKKFEALLTLGVANNRMKDFCDLWMVGQTFEFDRVSSRGYAPVHSRATPHALTGENADRSEQTVRG